MTRLDRRLRFLERVAGTTAAPRGGAGIEGSTTTNTRLLTEGEPYPDVPNGHLYVVFDYDGGWIAYRWDGTTKVSTGKQEGTTAPTTLATLQGLSYPITL